MKRKGSVDDPAYVMDMITDQFGPEIAKNVERIYRLETRNFTSGQYLRGRSAGQEAAGDSFPWGWESMRTLLANKSGTGSDRLRSLDF